MTDTLKLKQLKLAEREKAKTKTTKNREHFIRAGRVFMTVELILFTDTIAVGFGLVVAYLFAQWRPDHTWLFIVLAFWLASRIVAAFLIIAYAVVVDDARRNAAGGCDA